MKKLGQLKIISVFFLLFAIFSFAAEVRASTTTPANLTNDNCYWELNQITCTNKKFVIGNDIMCKGEKFFPENVCCCLIEAPLAPVKPVATLNNPFDNLNIDIPGLYKLISCKKNADGSYTCPKVDCIKGDDGSTTCEVPWIAQYIIALYNYALIIIGSLAAVTTMAGGVIWLISGSNASRMKVAKEMIIGSVSGLVVLFSSYMIISVINPDILIFKSLKIQYIPEAMPDFSDSAPGSGNPYQEGCDEFKRTGGDTSKCEELASKITVTLVDYQNKKVSPIMKEKLERAFACVKQKNGKDLFYVNGGARTVEQSLRYWKAFKNGTGNTAAKPCCSNHMGGNAVDISRNEGGKMSWDYNISSGLKDCMNKNGLYAKIGNEPWHWSLTGN